MIDIRIKVKDFFVRELWDVDISSLSSFKAFSVRFLRLLYVATRELSAGQLNLRAMSLVYTTLLSLVPLIAVSFSVLKAFGVHNQVEPMLANFLAPLGPRGVEITEKIIGFVENMKVGVLGSIGLALLIYTVISLIKKIEDALNYIWKIKKSRSLARRFSDYLSVILIGPVLIFSAIGIGASIMSTSLVERLTAIEPFGTAFYFTGKLLPYIFVCSAFTFLYVFLPNVKVKLRSALAGGIFAGILWATIEWAFASFIVSSTKYMAIYSSFAILILFMIWLYLGWLILLVGAEVAFYHQFPQFLTVEKERLSLSNRLKERLAFVIMYLIGYNYYHNKDPWTINAIIEHLKMPFEPVQDLIGILESKKFIKETGDDPPAYLPARDIETIKLKDILNGVRRAEEEFYTAEEERLSLKEIDHMVRKINDAVNNSLAETSLKSLVLQNDEQKGM